MGIPEPAVTHLRSTVKHSGPFSFHLIAAPARGVLGALVFLAFSSPAAFSQWKSFDRPTEDFRAIAVSGTSIFALSSPLGLYRSTNDGVTWSLERWRGTTGREPFCLSIVDGTPIAGISGGYYFLGLEREFSSHAIPGVNDDIQAVGYTTRDSITTLYLGGFGGGVRRSTDAGKNWALCNDGLSDLHVTSFTTIPAPGGTGQVLFAGTYGGGVFRTDDDGSHWVSTGSGLPNLYVYAMSAHGDTVYATHSGGCVSRSLDAGATWTGFGTGLPFTDVISIALVTQGHTQMIFAGTLDRGIWRYDPPGGTWAPVITGSTGLRINAIVPKDTIVFVATDRGLLCSTDLGTSWRCTDNGARPLVSSIVAASFSSGAPLTRIFVETESHYYDQNPFTMSSDPSSMVCWTDDLGETWTRTPFRPALISTRSRCQHFAVQQDECIFLTNHRWGEYGTLLCLLSTDRGTSWGDRPGNPYFRYGTVNGVAIRTAPSGSGFEVFVQILGGPSWGLWCSADSGKNWTEMTYPTERRIDIPLLVDGSDLYATSSGVPIWTPDGGKTWNTISYNDLYRSVPPGLTDSLPVLRLLHARDGRIVAQVPTGAVPGDPGGLYASTDHGTSWAPAGFIGESVDRIIATDSIIFAVQSGHVFASRSDAFLWKDLSDDLAADSIAMITASAEYVVALTQASDRIWYRPMAEIKAFLSDTPVDVPRTTPTTFALRQNYPNPFNPSTTIAYQLPVSGNVKLAVFDLLGREVAVLVDETKTAGRYDVRFDASGLSSGVYFYRMQLRVWGPAEGGPRHSDAVGGIGAGTGSGDFIETRTLMLLR